MTYNIHPILVHFPVALLFLYSIIKILPLAKWWPNVAWKDIERTLLIFGVLGACAAMLTGETAQRIEEPPRDLVEAHSNFAAVATFFYCVLLFAEIVSIIKSKYGAAIKSEWMQKGMIIIETNLSNGIVSKIIAFLGLISITVTGMLGGVMVYGLTADPLAPIVLKILGINL